MKTFLTTFRHNKDFHLPWKRYLVLSKKDNVVVYPDMTIVKILAEHWVTWMFYEKLCLLLCAEIEHIQMFWIGTPLSKAVHEVSWKYRSSCTSWWRVYQGLSDPPGKSFQKLSAASLSAPRSSRMVAVATERKELIMVHFVWNSLEFKCNNLHIRPPSTNTTPLLKVGEGGFNVETVLSWFHTYMLWL